MLSLVIKPFFLTSKNPELFSCTEYPESVATLFLNTVFTRLILISKLVIKETL